MPPLTTTADSADSLPPRYTIDQLCAYIHRQLGAPTWTVELTKQQTADAVNDALSEVSQWRPLTFPLVVQMAASRSVYLDQHEDLTNPLSQGIVKVEFVEPSPAPTSLYYGNLLNTVPLFRTGMDEYDTFLRWRKTWLRVMSVAPDYHFDENRPCLYIHNPIERYHCTAWIMMGFGKTEELRAFDANWVKKYALAKAKMTYGEVLAKFSGVLPSPMQSLQLDQQKREKAQTDIDKLELELRGAQLFSPISMD